MSESASAGPTFSQPSTPTTGLQGYDLARRVQNHVPLLQRLRRALARDTDTKKTASSGRPPPQSGGTLHKDHQAMDQTTEMLGTLKESVVGIMQGAPEQRDGLLEKTFGEFQAAFEAHQAEELSKREPAEEEVLFKGLGCVSRIATLASRMASQVENIKIGADYDGDTKDADPASDEVSELLNHAVTMVELALRASVNEHVDIADPDEDAEDDMNYVEAPTADGAGSLILKAALPEELLKFATDPAAIGLSVIQVGAGMMIDGGVSEESLTKVFELDADTEVLRKDAGTDPNADPNADPSADPSAQPTDDGAVDPNDIVQQIEIAGRIMAAGLMQVEHLMQLVTGGDAGADPGTAGAADPAADPNADPSADPSADPAAADPSADPAAAAPAAAAPAAPAGGDAPPAKPDDKKKPNPFAKVADANDLRKMAEDNDALRKRAEDVDATMKSAMALIETLKRTPVAPKGVLQTTTLSKAADAGGTDGEPMLKALATEYANARGDDGKRQVLMKAQFKRKGTTAEDLEKAI